MARDRENRNLRSPLLANGGRLPGGIVAAALAALAAMWIVSGSAGLMAHPWRRGLTWLALGCVVVFGWPPRRADRSRAGQVIAVLAGACIAVLLVAALRPAVGMLGVVVLLGAMAIAHCGAARSALVAVACAALVAAVFRVALTSFGTVWLLADWAGWLMGVVGWLAVGGPLWGGALGKAPWIGATMAGLEILLPMLLLAVCGPLGIGGARRGDGSLLLRLLASFGAVIVGQLLYLGLFVLLGAAATQAPEEKPPPSRFEALIYGKPMPRLELLAAKLAASHWWTRQPESGEVKKPAGQAAPGAESRAAQPRPDVQAESQSAGPPGAVKYAGLLAAGLVKHWLYNLPALAVVLQLAAGALVLRRWSGFAAPEQEAAAPAAAPPSRPANALPPGRRESRAQYRSFQDIPLGAVLTGAVLVVVAVLLGLSGTLTLQRPQPWGRKIVIYEKGYLNWLRPQHGEYGRLSVGMYGMMPTYLQSLGAWAVISPELSETDLANAHAVVLLFPNEPWTEGQLKRLWQFVRAGGTLLVMGEHTVFGADEPSAPPGAPHPPQGQTGENEEQPPAKQVAPLVADSPINQVLQPTDIRVAFDSATFGVGGWLHSYQTLSHPTTLGIDDQRNTFGVVIGASLVCGPRARPLIIGRWGWADPGDLQKKPSLMGNNRYDPGEKLGDLILAAEQPLGKGRVVVFGDTSGLTNGLTIGCHEYTSRLFAYLVTPASTPQSGWRQAVGVLLATLLVLLAVAAFWQRSPGAMLAAALALALALVACQNSTYKRWRVLPDGCLNQPGPNNLAYVDAAQMNLYSREGWRPDGEMGLCLTLMRNGFLTLSLPEIAADRLQRARLLVSLAPGRELSAREREVIRDFVHSGGIYICTVGYDAAGPSRRLLADFGFQVGPRPLRPAGPRKVPLLQRLWQWLGRKGTKAAAQRSADGGPGRAAALLEPEPLGHFKAPYFNGGDYLAYVRFHAAWPVWFLGSDAQKAREVLEVALYPPDQAVIMVRRYGKGLVAVVGDTCFAMNKNLENEDGSPFEGMRENAWFWRYFLCLLRDMQMPDGTREVPMWFPPNPALQSEPAAPFLPGQPPLPGQPALPEQPPGSGTPPAAEDQQPGPSPAGAVGPALGNPAPRPDERLHNERLHVEDEQKGSS